MRALAALLRGGHTPRLPTPGRVYNRPHHCRLNHPTPATSTRHHFRNASNLSPFSIFQLLAKEEGELVHPLLDHVEEITKHLDKIFLPVPLDLFPRYIVDGEEVYLCAETQELCVGDLMEEDKVMDQQPALQLQRRPTQTQLKKEDNNNNPTLLAIKPFLAGQPSHEIPSDVVELLDRQWGLVEAPRKTALLHNAALVHLVPMLSQHCTGFTVWQYTIAVDYNYLGAMPREVERDIMTLSRIFQNIKKIILP